MALRVGKDSALDAKVATKILETLALANTEIKVSDIVNALNSEKDIVWAIRPHILNTTSQGYAQNLIERLEKLNLIEVSYKSTKAAEALKRGPATHYTITHAGMAVLREKEEIDLGAKENLR